MNRRNTSMPRTRAIAVMTGLAACAVTVLLAVSGGCRQQEPAPSPDAAKYAPGRCDVTVSGALQKSFTSPGSRLAVATVYWMTDQELRHYFEWKAGEGDDSELVAEEDVPLVVDQAMARNPRFVTLLLMCSSPDTVITLLPGQGSRYEYVPFRPATYMIAPAFRVVDAVQGTFAAQTMIRPPGGGKPTKFAPVGFGKLIVQSFDDTHVAGNFAYDAEAGQQKIQVKGSFDFKKQAPAQVPVKAAQ